MIVYDRPTVQACIALVKSIPASTGDVYQPMLAMDFKFQVLDALLYMEGER